MKSLAWLIPLAMVVVGPGCQPQTRPGADEATPFTHGAMLGRVEAHKMGVWARTARSGKFAVRYGTRSDRLESLSPAVQTRVERDNTGWVHLTGLDSDTRYHYRLVWMDGAEEIPGPGGTFHTLPSADDVRHPQYNPEGRFNFRFEFACGNNQNTGGPGAFGSSLPAFATMLGELQGADSRARIDFAILNGDWLYEEKRQYPPQDWLRQVGLSAGQTPEVVEVMPNIVGVWENYKLYLDRGEHLPDWHRVVPSYFTFDDHEIVNDVYGAGEVGLRNRRPVFRDIALKAWYDYLGWSNPVDPPQEILFGRAAFRAGSSILNDPEADFSQLDPREAATLHVHWGTPDAGVMDGPSDTEGGNPNAGVYRIVEVLDANRLKIRPAARADGTAAYSIGRVSHFRKSVSNADFFFLDTRSHRMMHDVRQPRKKGLSMIGAPQKDWLKREMKASRADLFFVVSSVNFTIPHVGAYGPEPIPNKDEAWTVFLEEREDLIRFWDSLGKPVFVLTGDLHNSFAIKITDRVWEFASGPHNSSNHPLSSEGGRPTNGAYDSQGRRVEIRWSSFMQPDTPLPMRNRPVYCVVQVNNAFNNPIEEGTDRWVAYSRPQVIFQYYDGLTGELLYAESILAG